MKPFDLEAAKRGAAVMTTNGRRVKILCFDKKGESPIAATIDFEGHEQVYDYFEDGTIPIPAPSRLFLMMRDDDYLERLERGEYRDHIADVGKMVTPTVEEKLTVATCKESLPVGLSKREWFAGMAMAGIFAGRNWPHGAMIPDCINYARNAVELADALIAELEKNE